MFPFQARILECGSWTRRSARSGRIRAGGGPAPPTLHIWNWHQRRLRSQEVLTLHDSLNVGLGFLGKGDHGRVVLGGLGLRIGALSPAPPAAAGPEGGGHDLRGPPLPGLQTPRAQDGGAGLRCLGWGRGPSGSREPQVLLEGEGGPSAEWTEGVGEATSPTSTPASESGALGSRTQRPQPRGLQGLPALRPWAGFTGRPLGPGASKPPLHTSMRCSLIAP